MGASSAYITMITSRHRAGRRQPTSSQTSGVKSGSGLRCVCEVRHRCDCCCLRDACTRASDRAAGLPRGRTGMARQHSLVVCISARPRRKRWASDTGEVRIMMRGLGQATDEARKATKQAYCSFSRGAPGEGDKGAMLGCHAVSVGRNFTSEYYASPSDSSPRLRHNRGCEVHRTRACCKGWTAHHPT